MSFNNANNPQVRTAYIGTHSATHSSPAFYLPKDFVVRSVLFTDQAGVAADNTNYLTLTLQLGATVVATYDTRAANQGALTALVSGAAALAAGLIAGEVTGGVANELAPGDYKVVITVGGTCTTTEMQCHLYGYNK